MSSSCSFFLFLTSLAHLLLLASCFTLSFGLSNHHRGQGSSQLFPRGLSFEEKTRLGSTPPSCYNKCNRCHPCMAVQVPTMPSHSQILPKTRAKMEVLDPSPPGNRYSNYKPLGWKCRCGDHIFTP